jgi:hypothetical protein
MVKLICLNPQTTGAGVCGLLLSSGGRDLEKKEPIRAMPILFSSKKTIYEAILLHYPL